MSSNLSDPLILPCGLTLPNRLAKVSLTEMMAGSTKGAPNSMYENLFSEWGSGGWGLIITGNVHVDRNWIGLPGETTGDFGALANSPPDSDLIGPFRKWAEASKHHGTPSLVQINHPGRQSAILTCNRWPWEYTLAPSGIPLSLGEGFIARQIRKFLFGTPRAMTVGEIEEVVRHFVDASRTMAAAGFDGIEIHAAHGYLLSQFLSSASNVRTDAYGGSPAARAKIVLDIIKSVREAVPLASSGKKFAIGIKLNSADHQIEGELDAVIQQLKLITEAGVDFVEISGGSYSDPKMFLGTENTRRSERTAAREAFFLEFAKTARAELPNVPLMLTGGFRSRAGMKFALETEKACDLIGLGRPSIIEPAVPKEKLLNPNVYDEDAHIKLRDFGKNRLGELLGVKSLGVGIENDWYGNAMRKLATTARPVV